MLTDKQIEYLKETFLCYITKDDKDYNYHHKKRRIISENISCDEFYEVSDLSTLIFYSAYIEEIDRLIEVNKNEMKGNEKP